MLTEQETQDMHAMVTEFEPREKLLQRYKLNRLAETTGDEWEKLVREYLAEWRAERRSDGR